MSMYGLEIFTEMKLLEIIGSEVFGSVSIVKKLNMEIIYFLDYLKMKASFSQQYKQAQGD